MLIRYVARSMDAKVYKYGHPSSLPVNAIVPLSALPENRQIPNTSGFHAGLERVL